MIKAPVFLNVATILPDHVKADHHPLEGNMAKSNSAKDRCLNH
jgi:hypothetical protein